MSEIPDRKGQGPPDDFETVLEKAEAPPVAPAPEAVGILAETPMNRPEEVPPAWLEPRLNELSDRLVALQDRLASLEAAVESATRQIAFIPPQVRMLGNRIEGIATAITEPRYRAVLLNLLGVYDLVDQVLRTLPPTTESDPVAEHRRNYQVLRTQLRQVLDANGLSEIPTDGPFNPELHRATQTVFCTESAESGRVVGVVRPGFRTEQAVLRYAEVIVSRYAPPDQEK